MKTFREKLAYSDVTELLSKAYCDEWLAYYQYWLGAELVQGSARVIRELRQHAEEELDHASWIMGIFKKLGMRPTMDPDRWKKMSNCAFTSPMDIRESVVLKQNLAGEMCAVSVYENLLKVTEGEIHEVVENILEQEREHVKDLSSLLKKVK